MATQAGELGVDSVLAKFVFRNSELRPDGRVKSRNLVPRAGEALSVTDIDGLEDDQICAHGRKYVDNPAIDRDSIGYCKYPISGLSDISITPDYDNSPPRHVSLYFPDDLAKREEAALLLERQAIKCNESNRPYFVQFA